MSILYERKRDNFHWESHRICVVWDESLEFHPNVIEPPFHITKRDFLPNFLAARRARDPTGFFALRGSRSESHARLQRHLTRRSQAA